MAKIDIKTYDITLAEVDKALIKKKSEEPPRHYLGMSQIGEECQRKLFYSFRGAEERENTIESIRSTEDGHNQEAVMAERLRMVPGIELITVDPDNPKKQIGFSLLLGHFRGHCDGAILGVMEAPGTWHVWEHKSVDKPFEKLKKIREEKGEKSALREWSPEYYAQAQIYMHEMRLTRHFLTVSTPGGRNYVSIRTEYNRKEAEAIIEKAKSIIFDNWVLPPRISEKREFFKCKWCEYQEICHDERFPLVNCKTCRYSEPIDGGVRLCQLEDKIIQEDILYIGCGQHLYNPALISGVMLIEHKDDHVIYSIEAKKIKFANVSTASFPNLGSDFDIIYTSKDLRDNIKFASGIKKEKNILESGEVVTGEKKKWDTVNKIDPRLRGV
jgi:CRISPR/Cas system-associated exonuclease Cas4 (RecB family)